MFTIAQFIKLIQKYIYLLIAVPIIMASLVFLLTRNETKTYSSETVVYTGIASGASIVSQEESKVDFFGVKIVFDNLINIIESRETVEETGIRLLAQHLMIDESDPNIISKENYNELMKNVPDDVKALVVKGDTEKTVKNLKAYVTQSPDNYIYKLLHLKHPHYSARAISQIKVKRINNSDLVSIKYQNNDPGITQNTLRILTDVFIENYKDIKFNQSSDVVAYFERQVDEAQDRLRAAEDRLLKFNQDNNIINYYEQSKFIADQKEKLAVRISTIRMEKVSAEAAVKELESKLNNKEKIQISSGDIVKYRDQLSDITSKIASLEGINKKVNNKKLDSLKTKAAEIKSKLGEKISELQSYSKSKEGLDINTILGNWLENVIKLEETKARMSILAERKIDFDRTYKRFAPLGAKLKRIEREIGVAEEAYLSLLYSLSLAKLKQQNIELSTQAKVVDNPYFPIAPEPSKRKLLIIAAAMIGFLFTLALIIILEYLDTTIKTIERAEKLIGLEIAGAFPLLIRHNPKKLNFEFIKKRLIELIAQNIKLNIKSNSKTKKIILFSTQPVEGKTTIGSRLADKFAEFGNKTLYLNFKDEEKENSIKQNSFDYAEYHIDDSLFEKENINELLDINESDYDYIFLEIAAVLKKPYPVNIIKNADQIFLVVRANRSWQKADIKALDTIKEISVLQPKTIVNGLELNQIEGVLGELPKKRSRIRRVIKKVLSFQINSRYLLRNKEQ